MSAEGGPAPCVLVADDEPLVRDMLARAVRSMGLEALTAGSGEEALALYRQQAGRVALILMDLNMPGMGGAAALAELSRADPPARVLLTTGAADLLGADDLARLGAAGALAKPVRLPELERAVRALLPPW
jgi:CheY-like chemotaxis protein